MPNDRAVMATFKREFQDIVNRVGRILYDAPSGERILTKAYMTVNALKTNLIDLQSTHMLIEYIEKFRDQLKTVALENQDSPLAGNLNDVIKNLTDGIDELQRNSNDIQEMVPIIKRYLQVIGTTMKSYSGVHETHIHSIGDVLLITTLGSHSALQWHAIGRIATLLETLTRHPA